MADARSTFIKAAAPGARKGALEFGVPASVTLAQAALESGFGAFHLGAANNYFGIKAFARGGRVDVGPIANGFVVKSTHEVVGGRTITVQARFRSYASMADSMRDHGRFLKTNSRYTPCFAHQRDPNRFARELQRAGYATDPHYADKLIGLMRSFDLYQFDAPLGDAKVHRALSVHDAPSGADVFALQHSVNARLAARGLRRHRVVAGGSFDAGSARACRKALWAIGASPELVEAARAGQVGLDAQRLLRKPKLRAAEDRVRERKRLASLRGRPPKPASPDEPKPAGDGTPAPHLNGEPARAYVAAVQRDLNAHLRRLGSRELLAVDGLWDRYTERAFRRVCRVLGIEPERSVRTYRVIAGGIADRTEAELDRAAQDGAAFAERLKARFATVKPAPDAPARTIVGGRPLPVRQRERAYVAALQRDLNTQLARLGAPVPLAVDGDWGAATERAFRRVCRVLGLEPARTPRTFRIISGASTQRTPAELAAAQGDGAAFAKRLEALFHEAPEPPPNGDGGGDAHPVEPARNGARTFRLDRPPVAGADVAAFQHVLNDRFSRWAVAKRIEVDGQYGVGTRRAARQVAYGLGLPARAYVHGVGPAVRILIRTPSRRSDDERARAERRRAWLRRLRKQYRGGGGLLAVAYARQHIGVTETGHNRGAMIDKWNTAARSPLGSDWCGNFMNACLMAAGFPSEWWMAACRLIEQHAQGRVGGWEWTTSPRPGDLALFTVNGAANHVGIVEQVGSTQIVTIEGNSHKDIDPQHAGMGYGVFRRHHSPGTVRGYARPPYGR